MNNKFPIGVDCGTDTIRTKIVNPTKGNEFIASFFYYLHCNNGLYFKASQNQFRQHFKDCTEGLTYIIKTCWHQAGTEVAAITSAISVGTTGFAPVSQQKLKQYTKILFLP